MGEDFLLTTVVTVCVQCTFFSFPCAVLWRCLAGGWWRQCWRSWLPANHVRFNPWNNFKCAVQCFIQCGRQCQLHHHSVSYLSRLCRHWASCFCRRCNGERDVSQHHVWHCTAWGVFESEVHVCRIFQCDADWRILLLSCFDTVSYVCILQFCMGKGFAMERLLECLHRAFARILKYFGYAKCHAFTGCSCASSWCSNFIHYLVLTWSLSAWQVTILSFVFRSRWLAGIHVFFPWCATGVDFVQPLLWKAHR